jgi:hypothetical protein
MVVQSVLRVGSIELALPDSPYELLAAFRDDMLQAKHVRLRQYWPEFGPPGDDDPVLSLQEYRVTAKLLADRLELMGFDEVTSLAMLSGTLAGGVAATRALLSLGMADPDPVGTELAGSLTDRTWIERLRESTDYLPGVSGPDLRSRSWLLSLISGLPFLRRLRVILTAFPEVEVILDQVKWAQHQDQKPPVSNSGDATEELRRQARAYSPVVVLTEGKTDAEFLEAGLSVLYPHLTDLIRFLDYERRPEGGVGAVINTLRAFAAAGIANRVVAIFDNDTAAADALRNIDLTSYAPHIMILRYPDLELAENYPTLGPPAQGSAGAPIVPANINGLAGSIELYLGEDVLVAEDGLLQPVQWTSFVRSMQQYQGEITNKAAVQDRFRTKYKQAREHPSTAQNGDWSGLRLIIDAIREAAQLAQYPPDDEEQAPVKPPVPGRPRNPR